MSNEAPPPKGLERRRWIIDRLNAGAKQTELAEQLGVTRQAIGDVWKRYRNEGDDFFKPKGRRPREVDTLTRKEMREFVEWLREHEPADVGEKSGYWTLYAVKRGIRRRLGKSVKIAIASDVLWTAFPDGPPNKPEFPEMPFDDDEYDIPGLPPLEKGSGYRPVQPPPPLPDDDDDDDDDLPSVEEMERMNRESTASLPPPTPPADVRRGKHAKGRKNPRTKPKRRKKR